MKWQRHEIQSYFWIYHKKLSDSLFRSFALMLACSRLWDSQVREIENAPPFFQITHDCHNVIGYSYDSDVYINHIGTCRPKMVWFLGHFGLKRGIHFALFGLAGIGCGFRGNYGCVWVFMYYHFKNRNMRIWNGFDFYCLSSNLSHDDIISA